MPYEIEGWVEVSHMKGEELNADYAWLGIIKIGILIDAADEVTEKIFGLSKPCTTGEYDANSFAKERGLPLNSSQEVSNDIEAIQIFEHQYRKGEFGGYTFATWRKSNLFHSQRRNERNPIAGLYFL